MWAEFATTSSAPSECRPIVGGGRARKCCSWLEFLKKFVHSQKHLNKRSLSSPTTAGLWKSFSCSWPLVPVRKCWLPLVAGEWNVSIYVTEWGEWLKWQMKRSEEKTKRNCSFWTHNIEIAYNNINFHPQSGRRTFLQVVILVEQQLGGSNRWGWCDPVGRMCEMRSGQREKVGHSECREKIKIYSLATFLFDSSTSFSSYPAPWQWDHPQPTTGHVPLRWMLATQNASL